MKHSKLLRKVSIVGVSALCALALAGCGGTNYGYTGGVAATVNGTEIAEDTVTKYIQDFRTTSSLTSDDDWGNWMSENSLDPSTVRSQVINYYVEQELLKQACKEKDITVDESEVNSQIETMKANYDSDSAWKDALSTAGITEEQYRESLESSLREKSLMEAVASDSNTADDASVLEMLKTYSSMFDGSKKSSHILFSSNDTNTAQSVLDQINAGTLDFATAAAQYSTDTASKDKGGDVGWDSINSFVEAYTTALDGLEVNQVSGLVTSDYGIHIIKCTQTFTAPSDVTSLDQFPSEFVDYMRKIIASQNESTAYTNWFQSYEDQADVQNNEMPEKVPYNLDMTKYQSTESSTDSTSTSSTTANSTSSTTESSQPAEQN